MVWVSEKKLTALLRDVILREVTAEVRRIAAAEVDARISPVLRDEAAQAFRDMAMICQAVVAHEEQLKYLETAVAALQSPAMQRIGGTSPTDTRET